MCQHLIGFALMMEMENIPETLLFNSTLTWPIARKAFTTCYAYLYVRSTVKYKPNISKKQTTNIRLYTYTEPLLSNDRGIRIQTHRLMGEIF
jgi:hypothetical protein